MIVSPSAGKICQALIEDAARKSHAHDFIQYLPQGYATDIGEDGGNLSGGQKQRLALARLFLSNPQVLILDEPTSAIDKASEHLILESIREHFKGKTKIFITHSAKPCAFADRILTLEGGRFVRS